MKECSKYEEICQNDHCVAQLKSAWLRQLKVFETQSFIYSHFNTLHDITIKDTVGEGRKGMWRERSFALGFCLLPHACSLDTDLLCHNDSCLKPLDICSPRIVISSQGLTVFSLQQVSGKSNCEIKQDLIPGSNQRRTELFTKRDSQKKKKKKTGGSLVIKVRFVMHPARRGLLQTLLQEAALLNKQLHLRFPSATCFFWGKSCTELALQCQTSDVGLATAS